MKSFVVQIDSLNQRNEELTQENRQYRKQYSNIQSEYKQLEKQKAALDEKVEIASQLESSGLVALGLNSKGKSTSKSKKVEKIKVCFTILKNLTANVGEKDVYVRILRPDESLLMKSAGDKFDYEGSQINYSASRKIEYGGKNLEVCVFYDSEEGELMPGEYLIHVFVDGNNVGSGPMELK